MKAERISALPDWPGRMDDDLAAKYLGVGVTTFRERVRRREYPQPVRDGSRVLWAKIQLDRFIAAQFGLPLDAALGQSASSSSWDDV